MTHHTPPEVAWRARLILGIVQGTHTVTDVAPLIPQLRVCDLDRVSRAHRAGFLGLAEIRATRAAAAAAAIAAAADQR